MSDLGSNTETNSGGTYAAGNADFSSTSSGSTNENNGHLEDSQGVDESNEIDSALVAIDTQLQEITHQNQAMLTVNVVLVIAVFLSFGALCVQTLINSFEVRK